jgi:PPP family 3-phenylpropionic acid transporter
MGSSTLIAGWLYPRAGSLTYLAMAAIAIVSLIAALRLAKIWNGGALVAEPVS